MKRAAVSGFRSGWFRVAPWYSAMVLVLVTTGHCKTTYGVGETLEKQPSAADLLREVYAAEAWIRQVDSCLIRTKGVQSKPTQRESTPPPSAAEFEQLHNHGDWQETQQWKTEIAWDKEQLKGQPAADYVEAHQSRDPEALQLQGSPSGVGSIPASG